MQLGKGGVEGNGGDILDAGTVDTWRGGASFTLRNRIYRALWTVAWVILARWTLPQWHEWRRFVLRAFGANIASGAGIYPSVKIWSPANLIVEKGAFIGPRVTVYSMDKIHLGRYALVSQGAHLCTGTHDIQDKNFQLKTRPIHIGAHAWVAAEAFVGPGVVIGEGAVLGARACTFRNIAPFSVYVGNPATQVGTRNVSFEDSED